MDVLSRSEWLRRILNSRTNLQSPYLALYSTWWDGVVTDPELMMVPLDDHMVHRGDGVFEALRVVQGRIFDLDSHLTRLESSARSIHLNLPKPIQEIRKHCLSLVALTQVNSALLRIFVSRGPGSFSPNPYESPQSHLWIVMTEFKPIPDAQYQDGVAIIFSKIPQKPHFFAQIKSCNYLPNVLMKKEAVDQNVAFSIGVSELGTVLEGPTENLAIINADGKFRAPAFVQTLRGTTLLKVAKLIEERDIFSQIRNADWNQGLTSAEVLSAQEVMMIGTTLEVLPVVQVEKQKIGDGRPGPWSQKLRQHLQGLMSCNSHALSGRD